jgi:hypothetical protein
MKRRHTIEILTAVASVLAALALAAPASAAFEIEHTLGNGRVADFAVGPRWVAWTELAEDGLSACVQAFHLDVGPASQRALWCGGWSFPALGMAVGTGHIVWARANGLNVYDIDTGETTFVPTEHAPFGLRIDGTRLVWQQPVSHYWMRLYYLDLSQPSSRPLLLHGNKVPNGVVRSCIDISGDAAVYSDSVWHGDPFTSRVYGRRVFGSGWRIWGPRQGQPLPCPRVSGDRIAFEMYYENAYLLTSLDGASYYQLVRLEPHLRSIEALDLESAVVALIVKDDTDRYRLHVPGRADLLVSTADALRGVEISGSRVATVRHRVAGGNPAGIPGDLMIVKLTGHSPGPVGLPAVSSGS